MIFDNGTIVFTSFFFFKNIFNQRFILKQIFN